MADTLPSPPNSTRSALETGTDNLATRLDSLLEEYLNLLDQYTKLRDDLSKTFSSGFFSLAQAQRTSTLGAGRRYGEEYYDQRMKAQRKILWEPSATSGELTCKVMRMPKNDDSKSKNEDSSQSPRNSSKDKGETEQSEKLSDKENKDQLESSEKPSKTTRSKQDPATRDPLTWFGILVPPALRQTQAQFVKASEDQIPFLVVLASRLRLTEQQIWAVREELGILSEYDHEEEETADESVGDEEVKEEAKTKTARESNRGSRKSLASRPAHSKSHLLKLGD